MEASAVVDIAPPSHTALAVARHRALHQSLDDPLVLVDPLVTALIGKDSLRITNKRARRKLTSPLARKVRTFLCMRSHLAEAKVMHFVESDTLNGDKQVVLVGAGLDTFAMRWQPPE